jgi:pilus assembly protein Flp/PilA
MIFLPQERGQGLVEYALILVLVALVATVALTVLGGKINEVFSYIAAVCA